MTLKCHLEYHLNLHLSCNFKIKKYKRINVGDQRLKYSVFLFFFFMRSVYHVIYVYFIKKICIHSINLIMIKYSRHAHCVNTHARSFVSGKTEKLTRGSENVWTKCHQIWMIIQKTQVTSFFLDIVDAFKAFVSCWINWW